MRDRDLYATPLGVTPPWEVVDVVVDDTRQMVEVHLATKAGAEGLDSGIQRIKAQARGFRNREHFRRAIYFHFG